MGMRRTSRPWRPVGHAANAHLPLSAFYLSAAHRRLISTITSAISPRRGHVFAFHARQAASRGRLQLASAAETAAHAVTMHTHGARRLPLMFTRPMTKLLRHSPAAAATESTASHQSHMTIIDRQALAS